MSITLEVCVDSVESAIAADTGGAQRPSEAEEILGDIPTEPRRSVIRDTDVARLRKALDAIDSFLRTGTPVQ